MGSDLSNHAVATATEHRAGGVVGADREHAAGADRNTGAEHLSIDPVPRSAAKKTHVGNEGETSRTNKASWCNVSCTY